MSYRNIIRDNCQNHSGVHWWPKFAYHYTDVKNAVSILSSGMLYSRAYAEQLGVMKNDNASKQVIDMTQTEAISCARFYFRPLTPTQYYNEGFKHPQLRYDNDKNANTPVPIFLAFDLEKLLSLPEIQFSEQKQSGYGSKLCNTEEAFSKFNFDYIYSKDLRNIAETKSYRHAEILHPKSFMIDSCLHAILCRNSVERTTLLNLLRKANSKAFYKYADKIKICRENMFEENGLYVQDCQYHNGTLSITFSDTYIRRNYTANMKARNAINELKPITVRLSMDWYNQKNIIYHTDVSTKIDYEESKGVIFRSVPQYPKTKNLAVQIYFDDDLMGLMDFALSDSEIIK